MKLITNKIIILFTLICLVSFQSCTQKKERIFKKSKILMDTIVTITIVSDSENKANNSINATFDELERLEHLLNFYSDDSEISRINKLAGIRPVKVSKDTYEIIKRAVEIAEISSGAYDPTIGPIMSLWDFNNKIKPGDSDIKKKLPLVNYKNVISNNTDLSIMLKTKSMLLELGGIAKGFAADNAVNILKNSGIKSGIVAIAGDIRVFGLKPDDKRWRIGIRAPGEERNKIVAVLGLNEMSVSTSGDYERYFIQEDIKYHHLLNPKTGYPVHDFHSVTVVSDEGVLSDAISTAVFILGKKEGMELIKKLNLKAFIVDNKGMISATESIRGIIETEGNNKIDNFF